MECLFWTIYFPLLTLFCFLTTKCWPTHTQSETYTLTDRKRRWAVGDGVDSCGVTGDPHLEKCLLCCDEVSLQWKRGGVTWQRRGLMKKTKNRGILKIINGSHNKWQNLSFCLYVEGKTHLDEIIKYSRITQCVILERVLMEFYRHKLKLSDSNDKKSFYSKILILSRSIINSTTWKSKIHCKCHTDTLFPQI